MRCWTQKRNKQSYANPKFVVVFIGFVVVAVVAIPVIVIVIVIIIIIVIVIVTLIVIVIIFRSPSGSRSPGHLDRGTSLVQTQ